MTKDEILKADWINLGRWLQPTISGCFWTHWCESISSREILPGYVPSQLLWLDGHTLVLKKDQETIAAILGEVYAQNRLSELCDRLEDVARVREKRHQGLLEQTELSIGEYVTELTDSYREVVGVWTMSILVAQEAEALAKSRRLVSSDDELLQKMRPFMRTTWLEEQLHDVSAIAKAVQEKGIDNADVQKRIDAHLKTFSWYGTHHWNGEGYNRNKSLADIQRANAQNAEPDLLHEKEANDALWRLIALCSYWRTHCAEVTAKVVFLSREKMAELAGEWGMTYDDFTYLSAAEIVRYLDGMHDKPKLPDNYSERRTAYGCYIEDETEQVVTGESLNQIVGTLVTSKPAGSVSEFKGVVASKGSVVRGRARIVLSPADFNRFQEGEILIVPETTPDFVPLMKIAAAIVTEVGGITSHAAIVSRELKKPCIIGTKIATQVLKDGDMVEVDANNGIVRKVNE